MKYFIAILVIACIAPAHAFEWSDLWLNDYQKAHKLLQEQPEKAAETFHDPEWQGVAKYHAGNFPEAAEKFSESGDLASEYNLGNALAKAGDLEKSLRSYDQLLEKPDLPEKLRDDAAFNRDLVKKAMEQRQQDQQQSEDNSQDSSESDEKQEPQDGGQEGQESELQQSGQQGESDQEEGRSSEQENKPEPLDEQQKEQQQAEKSAEEKQGEESEQAKNQVQANQDQPMTEDQQATEQWLRQIPDDPSGLLRRKLVQSHRTKYPQVQNGGQAW